MALKNTIEGFDNYQNDWLKQEQRREASISAWDLDDNAGYLDAEHRRHCEASELRKKHERNCAVKEAKEELTQRYGVKSTVSAVHSIQGTPVGRKRADSASTWDYIWIALLIIFWLVSFL